MGCGFSSVVQHLPDKHEVLSSIPVQKEKRERGREAKKGKERGGEGKEKNATESSLSKLGRLPIPGRKRSHVKRS